MYRHPVRLELFGDEIESIRLYDAATQRTLRPLELAHVQYTGWAFRNRAELLLHFGRFYRRPEVQRVALQRSRPQGRLQCPQSVLVRVTSKLESQVATEPVLD